MTINKFTQQTDSSTHLLRRARRRHGGRTDPVLGACSCGRLVASRPVSRRRRRVKEKPVGDQRRSRAIVSVSRSALITGGETASSETVRAANSAEESRE